MFSWQSRITKFLSFGCPPSCLSKYSCKLSNCWDSDGGNGWREVPFVSSQTIWANHDALNKSSEGQYTIAAMAETANRIMLRAVCAPFVQGQRAVTQDAGCNCHCGGLHVGEERQLCDLHGQRPHCIQSMTSMPEMLAHVWHVFAGRVLLQPPLVEWLPNIWIKLPWQNRICEWGMYIPSQ